MLATALVSMWFFMLLKYFYFIFLLLWSVSAQLTGYYYYSLHLIRNWISHLMLTRLKNEMQKRFIKSYWRNRWENRGEIWERISFWIFELIVAVLSGMNFELFLIISLCTCKLCLIPLDFGTLIQVIILKLIFIDLFYFRNSILLIKTSFMLTDISNIGITEVWVPKLTISSLIIMIKCKNDTLHSK